MTVNPTWARKAALLLLVTPALATAQTTHTVMVMNNFFSPSELTIEPGDTVRWNNPAGGPVHNVTSSDSPEAWEASETASGFIFEVTFDDPGVFDYECTIHFGMDGTITVEGQQSTPAEIELQSVEIMAGEFAPGAELTGKALFRNNGEDDSSAFNLTWYLSTDATINANDSQIGSFTSSGLSGGASSMSTDLLTLPADLTPGTYFIGAVIDFGDVNTGNNTALVDGSFVLVGFTINPGLNDAWFDPATAGQGFFFNVFPTVELFFLSWFTYDTERPDGSVMATLGEAGHRWVTALGTWEGNKVTLEVELTEGGVFDSPTPAVTQTTGYGSIMIVFHDCNNATLTYDLTGLGLSGTIELTRVTDDNVTLCEALQ